jgi:hypothetical protein
VPVHMPRWELNNFLSTRKTEKRIGGQIILTVAALSIYIQTNFIRIRAKVHGLKNLRHLLKTLERS